MNICLILTNKIIFCKGKNLQVYHTKYLTPAVYNILKVFTAARETEIVNSTQINSYCAFTNLRRTCKHNYQLITYEIILLPMF